MAATVGEPADRLEPRQMREVFRATEGLAAAAEALVGPVDELEVRLAVLLRPPGPLEEVDAQCCAPPARTG